MNNKNIRICKGCRGIINLDNHTGYYKQNYMIRHNYFCRLDCVIGYLKKKGLYGYKDEEHIKSNFTKY